ncbi:hypothetical protein ASF40_09405 [Microbacterium sp. Leaf288]|uniref:TetR/AcrR family transcriptional regulator n=1 Tax=Microbacterium sp. Leaf288 TaxID=1736323 RepID=UPI0006FABED7|nr:TetR/AcrR family transcriptional regulator [Microbacterium sp. Leaf288]KQP70041.1 hypothetical protein ASF40_09405 [Microbacterium sp. Leaf288]
MVTAAPTTSPGTAPARAGGSRGRYAKSEDVQQRIVGAATEVFGVSGYHAATFKEVSRRAGVSERGLAYHFPTKEALLAAVVDRHERWRSVMVLPATGLGAFAAVLAVVGADAGLPGIVTLHSLLSGEATPVDHPLHEHYRSRYLDLRTYLARAFAAAQAEGQAASVLSPEDLAAGMIALLDGLQLQWLYDQQAIDVVRIVEGHLAAVFTPTAMESIRALCGELMAAAEQRIRTAPA